jgi:16S rRNA (guanine1207-N2)-methyltransferase
MKPSPSATLFHPFETAVLEVPLAGNRVLFLGAEPGFRLPGGFTADLSLVQGFRPWFRALAGRYKIMPQPEEDDFDAALALCGRHRGENELRIAEAIGRTKAGGLVIVAGGKDDGIASMRKCVEGLVELEGQMPKHHGVAFWFRCPRDVSQAIAALRAGNGETLIEGRFVAAPGMFSSDRIDAGSKLLAAHLPERISGAVADFCAGWGFLAAEVARRYPKISALDLYEADFASLEAAKRNLAESGALEPRFFWHDLLAEEVPHRYDFVVMNPPFHQTREAEPDIGQRMIRAASAALKPGGRLLMVANRQLPYERTLAEVFSSHSEVARDGMFKVLSAKR